MNKKIIPSLFIFPFTLTVLSGCNSGGSSDVIETPSITGVEVEEQLHYVEGTLHKISNGEPYFPFVRNSRTPSAVTDYKIVYDKGDLKSSASRAANYIASNLANLTSCELELIEESESIQVDKSTKYIFLGCRDIFVRCGLSMPEEDIGFSGYYIKSYGSNIFIEVDRYAGFQTAGTAFLREVTGYDFIHDDFIMYDNDASQMPTLEIIERPDFDYRNWVNNSSNAKTYANGYFKGGLFVPVDGTEMHNASKWLPYDKWGSAHPYWFSNTVDTSWGHQLCYTAHGDKNEYDLMQEECLKVMIKYHNMYPAIENITLTQMDANMCCECDECNRVVNKDGGISATIIRFMNDLDNRFREVYPEANLNLVFFAYHKSTNAPTTPVSEDPTLKCNEHVVPLIAPINASYVKSFYDEENAVYADNIKNWCQYANHFIAWLYETNYEHYMYPYNSFQAIMEDYRFVRSYGCQFMYNEGQRFNTAVTCFGRFKDYLNAHSQSNVNVSYNKLKDKFFTNYYGDGGSYMEQFFNELYAWETYIEETYIANKGGIYEPIEKEEYWPKQLLEHFLDLVDKAYEAIQPIKSSNPSLYQSFYDHINIESISPRYGLCTLYSYLYSEEDLLNMRLKFKSDCEYLGVKEYHEVHSYAAAGNQGWMSEMFDQWGI